MHETNRPLASANTARSVTRWKALVLFATLAIAAPLAGCEDNDDNGGPADAGSDTAAPVVCRQSDCAGIALPQTACDNGGMIAATCARGTDNRCTWTQPRCTTPAPDATMDIVPQDA